jgi:hypothetical protein
MNSFDRTFRIAVGVFFSVNFALFWAIPILVQVTFPLLAACLCLVLCSVGSLMETLLSWIYDVCL